MWTLAIFVLVPHVISAEYGGLDTTQGISAEL
jgi:hypothetical protein